MKTAALKPCLLRRLTLKCFIMPLNADLYLDRIDLARYAREETCDVCHVDSMDELVARLRSGRICSGKCPHWPPERVEAFRLALDAGKLLPTIPSLDLPRPAETGLFDLNEPAPDSPLLVTGNSQLTHEVLLAVLATTTAPMWMLSVDTGGNTVDMSLVYKTLTPDAVAAALREDDRISPASPTRIILPGLAEPIAQPLAQALGRPVETGPICAAELPLFLSSAWLRPGDSESPRFL
ncbi:MAG: hypothetical protein JXQ73_31735 [Phycisphaerae bacterium]|nr:hypothetical protein [Phycisphaerae bacterium]